ncbi:alpha/beta hydrolase fold-domain-containing protein [Aspergillus leporis]|uniref:Alpha/beta hydrolase fold-domain-containing protein n=1 Tax=Aspergillus leporis TaxID=41062 RepID=A0A5N5WLC4_9EURO|nr:alpha/beta hydrolase fold-domain-containing protein [Aspergillus leporis]
MSTQWSIRLCLAGCLQIATTFASLQWSPCTSNPALDCATLEVPLEYADPESRALASIPLARFKATVPASQRKGSLLTNPGGPGAPGTSFVLNGAGEGISNITSGFYDIVGWDPRGVGSAQPLLQCFATAGEEYDASGSLPAAAEVEYSQFRNQSYMPSYNKGLQDFDTAVGKVANACSEYNSPALYTSSTAYVVRDMAAIVDALEGTNNATLNYWGFSYGTVFGTEFIQTYPERVGRVVLDGVFDAAANAEPYTSQLPNDQLSLRDALDDLISFCEQAGANGCALSNAPGNVTGDLTTRLANLQASLYDKPIALSDGSFSVTTGAFSAYMSSFLRLPTTWPLVVSAVSALEKGDATPMATILTNTAGSAPANTSAPDTASLAGWPLQCVDNAPSSSITLAEIASLVLNISLTQKTPWLDADLTPLSFCRQFPDRRPKLPNLGASKLTNIEADSALMRRNAKVLIVNPLHDPVTPLTSAQRLHGWLPTSSQLVTRRGPGHTTISLASLGLVETIRGYLLDGDLPAAEEVHDLSQVVFSSEIKADTLAPAAVFNGTYSEAERVLLGSTYRILLAFLALP